MKFSTGAGGFAAAMLLLLLGMFHPTPTRAWQMNPSVAAPAVPALPPATEAAPVPAVANQAQAAPEPTTLQPAIDVAEPRPAVAANKAEEQCLATAVYFEAKGEPRRGQLAVAQVILNRTRSGRFPVTICGVVRQRGQFSFVHGGHLPAVPHGAAREKSLAVARTVLQGSGERVASNALFFHARGVSAGWHAVRIAQIGNQVFYR